MPREFFPVQRRRHEIFESDHPLLYFVLLARYVCDEPDRPSARKPLVKQIRIGRLLGTLLLCLAFAAVLGIALQVAHRITHSVVGYFVALFVFLFPWGTLTTQLMSQRRMGIKLAARTFFATIAAWLAGISIYFVGMKTDARYGFQTFSVSTVMVRYIVPPIGAAIACCIFGLIQSSAGLPKSQDMTNNFP